jgi:hypothetical protein
MCRSGVFYRARAAAAMPQPLQLLSRSKEPLEGHCLCYKCWRMKVACWGMAAACRRHIYNQRLGKPGQGDGVVQVRRLTKHKKAWVAAEAMAMAVANEVNERASERVQCPRQRVNEGAGRGGGETWRERRRWCAQTVGKLMDKEHVSPSGRFRRMPSDDVFSPVEIYRCSSPREQAQFASERKKVPPRLLAATYVCGMYVQVM